jgi:hypothetical protein
MQVVVVVLLVENHQALMLMAEQAVQEAVEQAVLVLLEPLEPLTLVAVEVVVVFLVVDPLAEQAALVLLFFATQIQKQLQ